MAGEMTSTSWAARMLSEVLLPLAMKAHTPKVTVLPHVNRVSIDGAASDNVKITQDKDIGAASDLTENVDLTTNTDLGYETPVTITPSEIGLKGTFTRKAMRRALPGFTAAEVLAAMQGGDPVRMVSLLMPKAMAMLGALDEKVEDTLLNLFSGGSNTVGSTGVDLTIATIINSHYTLKTLDPTHEQWVTFLFPNQIQEIQLEQAVMANGNGAVFYNEADLSFFNFQEDIAQNGRRGSVLGVPLFEPSHSLRTLMNSNADVAGVTMCRGEGVPGSGRDGSFAWVEGAPPLFDSESDASARLGELVLTQEMGAAESDDSNFVTIVSDAP